jgi:hypothetical protein
MVDIEWMYAEVRLIFINFSHRKTLLLGWESFSNCNASHLSSERERLEFLARGLNSDLCNYKNMLRWNEDPHIIHKNFLNKLRIYIYIRQVRKQTTLQNSCFAASEHRTLHYQSPDYSSQQYETRKIISYLCHFNSEQALRDYLKLFLQHHVSEENYE